MREYYIRREGDEDSSGPFDIDQISSLMEAGKLDPSAYYYDIETESWATISSNEELMDTLFPKKRKLSLRTPELEAERKRLEAEAAAQAAGDESEGAEAKNLEEAVKDAAKEAKAKQKKEVPEEREKLDVTRMLALAEGRADDPGGLTPRERKASVALFGLRFLTLCFAFSIFAMLYIERDLVMTANALKMVKSPYIVVAAFDLLALFFLLLQVTSVYPLVRFRAAIGGGLLTMLYWASGDGLLVLSNALLMLAIYFCSAIVKLGVFIACIVAGLAGILGYVYVFFLR